MAQLTSTNINLSHIDPQSLRPTAPEPTMPGSGFRANKVPGRFSSNIDTTIARYIMT